MDAKPEQFTPHGMPTMHSGIVLNEHSSFSSAGSSIGPGVALPALPYSLPLTRDRQVLTKDGQPAKRRGPKPDSKPALTKRQQMNRQAQRTHRERRETYVRGIESDRQRLTDAWAHTQREKERVEVENHRMRALLAQHGIPYEPAASYDTPAEISGAEPSSSGSISGSYATGSDRGGMSPDSSMTPASSSYSNSSPQPRHQQMRSHAQTPSTRLDYDSIGIEFVLNLERPCMDHQQYLTLRAHNPEKQTFHHPQENADDAEHEHSCGHSRMLTAVPLKHIMEKPDEKYPHQPPSVSKSALAKLLEISGSLPIDQDLEITPIRAWNLLSSHPRIAELDQSDFEMITSFLGNRVRCYGFGAVVQKWELQDALETTFANKAMPSLTIGIAQQMVMGAA